MSALHDVSFCHLVVGVTDMDRAPTFYRDVLGMEIVFETPISGQPFDAVLHDTRKQEGLPGAVRSAYERQRGVPLLPGPAE